MSFQSVPKIGRQRRPNKVQQRLPRLWCAVNSRVEYLHALYVFRLVSLFSPDKNT